MLILKYSRTGSAAYLPHLDVLRQFGRVLRRAGLKINYSEGFHPHMLFWFGNPISLGIPTLCEYCAADSPEKAETFLARFNEKRIPGVELLLARETDKNPNFADILCAAEYEISCAGIGALAPEIRALATNPDFVVKYEGTARTKSAADKFLSLKSEPDSLRVRLKAGKENLKADMWMRSVLAELGESRAYSIVRTRQFWERGGELADADELFR